MKKNKLCITCFSLLFSMTVSFGATVTTNTNNVPLHIEKNNSKVILTIPNSITLEKASASGEWYNVTYEGTNGWINRAYTAEGAAEIEAEKEEIVATTVTGNYKNYKQAGQSWSSIKYSEGNIGTSGCGPTSVAICASGFGINLNPGEIVKKANGSSFSAGVSANSRLLSAIGLKQTKVSGTKLISHLSEGKPAIIHCRNGYYTKNGHFMALTGVRNNNGVTEVYISNPGSRQSAKNGWLAYAKLKQRGVDAFYIVDKK